MELVSALSWGGNTLVLPMVNKNKNEKKRKEKKRKLQLQIYSGGQAKERADIWVLGGGVVREIDR